MSGLGEENKLDSKDLTSSSDNDSEGSFGDQFAAMATKNRDRMDSRRGASLIKRPVKTETIGATRR
jgi:hypothetical protein